MNQLNFNIQKLCRRAGIENYYQLHKRIGVSVSQAEAFFKGGRNDKDGNLQPLGAIAFDSLQKLCDGLQCTPNDIFGVVKLLTMEQCAKYAGVESGSVKNWIHEGLSAGVGVEKDKLPVAGKNEKGHNVVAESDLEDYLERRGIKSR